MGWFSNVFRRNPKRRHCPVDWADLEPHALEASGPDVKADRCPKCHGLFLDNGEVLRLTGNPSLHTLLTKDLGLDSDSTYVCPACGGHMDAEQAGRTRVDVCLSCKGVWVDKGEVDSLMELTGEEARERSPEKKAELERAKAARKATRASAKKSAKAARGKGKKAKK